MVRLEGQVDEPDLLARPLARVVAPGTARALAALGPRTVGDLLRYYPRRYDDKGTATDLAGLVEGEHVTVIAQVDRAVLRSTRTGKALLEAVVGDGVHELRITFFAGHPAKLAHHRAALQHGQRAYFTGVVSRYNGQLQLTHPQFEPLEDGDDERATWPAPVYGASAAISSWQIAKAVHTVLDPITTDEVPDPLPDEVRAERGYLPLVDALRQVHEPHTADQWRAAQARLRFEEAFVLQAELARRHARAAEQLAVARPRRTGGLLDAFDARLPFALTDGQRAVGQELSAELGRTVPMQRLLQGEVGSGKTVVALRAMLQVVDAGGQAALLAPTEVLAAQHLGTLRALLGDLAEGGELGGAEGATRLALLTGSQSAASRRRALADAAGGAAGIVVGTHALLSEQVQLADLGLVVVDEQHRFGVDQRNALRDKARGSVPHTLVMTATPIPRTVAMTVFGDLETSTLTQVPAGRAEVVTHVVPADRPAWMERTWQRVRDAATDGGRAFVVAPRIDPDTTSDAAGPDGVSGGGDDEADLLLVDTRRALSSVVEVAAQLGERLAPVPVAVLHGRMPPEDKERAFADFASGRAPVLVSTTVIEVGVDVPAATVMVVLDADRFGLSQLHQLRGRIGRGDRPGLCLLVSAAPEGSDAAERLAALAATRDGFELAQRDLELRREGDVLGAAQSGVASSLRLLRVTRDGAVIERARTAARRLVAQDPELAGHPALRAAIESLLVGDREEYLDKA
ncbi:ATP-dependent DNA helicase RecG [Cellulomonas citrea]|uniref:ATP-dependent DNA helicase RecG n=1 Tax=Cellulomonas citrea TaxID=1909423 RepID=UPI00135AE300|nr:ATP-dependent DNA helicase RecG [Cellulomonas citrea]